MGIDQLDLLASGIAWAIARARREQLVRRGERAGRRQGGEEPRRALEQRRDSGGERRRPARPRGRSPAAGLADEPVEDARRDGPPVVGGRADVVDRLELAGKRLGRAVGRLRRRVGGPRGRPRWRAARIGVGRHRPEREADVAPAATAARRSRQASAITTLLIAWARRVPTLRKRSSRPGAQRDADPEQQLVRRERRRAVGRPERRRPGSSRSPRARAERRTRRRPRAGPAACRRPATRSRRCRRACRGSGSGPRRSSRPPRPAPAACSRHSAERRISRVRRQGAEDERVAVERDAAQLVEPPQVDDPSGGSPSSPVSRDHQVGAAGDRPDRRLREHRVGLGQRARADDRRLDGHRQPSGSRAGRVAGGGQRARGSARRGSPNPPRAEPVTRRRPSWASTASPSGPGASDRRRAGCAAGRTRVRHAAGPPARRRRAAIASTILV